MVIQASPKRLIVGVLVAFALAFMLAAVRPASAQMIPSGCKGLTPSDPMWWMRQCYIYMAVQPVVLVRFH